MTRVKICGITRVEDALAAAHLGAHAIGLVFYEKSPRCLDVARARGIVAALPPFVNTVALFVNPEVAEVEHVLDSVPVDVLQFHGEEPADFCRRFRRPYLKAARVRKGLDLVQYAAQYGDARGLLLDAYVEGAHGGTGATFDWELIPRALPLPVILSGGLSPVNVGGAIRQVRPWAVDVSSGVESAKGINTLKGIKDAAKIAAFIKEVKDVDLQLS
ncbi:MAG: phosphoribosylanthranilate isomerase [Pseudomonadota bacterium]